jgi:hypothetical protein
MPKAEGIAMKIAAAIAVLSTLTLVACEAPAEPADAAVPAVADPQPSEMLQQTFASCTWGKVEGSGLAVWSFDCSAGPGGSRLVADDSLPGFVIENTFEGETSRSPAIVIFKKAADAPIESILDAVRARSPGPNTATCTLQPVTFEGAVPGSFSLEPTGELAARWNAFASGEADSVEVEPPCGPMGPQMVGHRSFRVLEGDPTTVVLIEYGSEIQIFDPSTLRPAG